MRGGSGRRVRGVGILAVALVLLAGPAGLRAQAGDRGGLPPLVELPAELDRVLRDYERGWAAGDEAALAALFTEDGFILRPGNLPTVGRAAIQAAYANSGGPLVLRAYAYATDGAVGYIIGGYGYGDDALEGGKFVLALRRSPQGRWLIAADMDNGNGFPG